MSNKVSNDFVERYKCDICNGSLSRGPIHKIEGEKYHCGRCQPSDGEGIRIKILEDLAQGMLFPCQYKAYGCQAFIAFEENQTHEELCSFNPNAPRISVSEELVAGSAVYPSGWNCPIHAAPWRKCDRLRCPFNDIDVKCKKHMDYYCGSKCPICDADVTGMTLEQHYTKMHDNITCKAGTACPVRFNTQWQYIIVHSKIGKVFCRYQMQNGHFQLQVYSPLHSEKFSLYPAQVEISHPVSRRTLRCALIVQYNETYDWYLDIPLTRLSEFTHDSQVIIKLISPTSKKHQNSALCLSGCKILIREIICLLINFHN